MDADPDRSLLDAIADESVQAPENIMQSEAMQTQIQEWLQELSDKQREVVEHRFGLHGREVATLEEVGNELGVTRERVRQIQLEALKRLREIMEREGYSVENILK